MKLFGRNINFYYISSVIYIITRKLLKILILLESQIFQFLSILRKLWLSDE